MCDFLNPSFQGITGSSYEISIVDSHKTRVILKDNWLCSSAMDSTLEAYSFFSIFITFLNHYKIFSPLPSLIKFL